MKHHAQALYGNPLLIKILFHWHKLAFLNVYIVSNRDSPEIRDLGFVSMTDRCPNDNIA